MTKRQRPGVLAIRAVNQYRRRDVLTYLALRYYLDNDAARTDHWARHAATDLVLTRSSPVYFRALHFKDLSQRQDVDHRQMLLPGANEALAEAALLDECSRYPQAFANLPCVFSYPLNSGNDRSGIFEHYGKGLRNRHEAIAKACDETPDGDVQYIDLRKFYPSIAIPTALGAWRQAADSAGLAPKWRELGERLLADHGSASTDKPSILTGPMFSHLIANLVLRSLDAEFSSSAKVRYFRYVDDITLVGAREYVTQALREIRARVDAIGFAVHDDDSPKSLRLTSGEWLVGRHDFRDSRRPISWMTFVGDLKRFLLANPNARDSLQEAFASAGSRIPVRDYSSAIFERSYLERIAKWAERAWFRKKVRAVSIDSLVKQALWLRSSYEDEFAALMDGFHKASAYERKRRIPKLRYRAGRLSYLATEESLAELAKHAGQIRDLHLHSTIMTAVASGDINPLLLLGTNAAQAAAQPMRAGSKLATFQSRELTDAESQALAVFHLNGVSMATAPKQMRGETTLLSFAEHGASPALMRSSDPFMSELSCLHGFSDHPRHAAILESVFDEDEELALDAVDQLGQSPSP
ncbi:MAG: RNA-directed DNA polymerase [Gammaproteobacteria bacterium]|nr:RNA-directed DNA polymerase [Gammaproteobacteria bacterium]MBU1415017.1 RNA-directed DNA polymerase [Gammaproteobacteria bacterium]